MSCVNCNKPAQLPVILNCNLRDVYCFLCLKDIIVKSNGTAKCVICNTDIDVDIDNVSQDFRQTLENFNGKSVWLYSAMSQDGWWMYNPDTSAKIETNYSNNMPLCSFLIGDKTYKITFNNMLQVLVDGGGDGNTVKQRITKRVIFSKSMIEQMNIKGIAGVYFKTIEDEIGKFV